MNRMEEKQNTQGIILKDVDLADLSVMIISSVRTAMAERPAPIPMTKNEVCRILSISEPKLRNWVKKGMLHPIEIGNKFFYDTCEVMKIVERLR